MMTTRASQMQHNQMMRFARALFDNVADMRQELSFKKGDILTILQDKYENNPEWWVCSLRNMVGLAPANRLESLPVLIEATPQFQKQISGCYYDELPEQPIVDNTYSNFPDLTLQSNQLDEQSVYQIPLDGVYSNMAVNRQSSSDNVDEESVYQLPSDNSRRNSVTHFSIPDLFATSTHPLVAYDVKNPSTQNIKTGEYYNNRYDYSDSFSDATSTSFTDTIGSSLNSFNQLSLSSSESGDLKLLPPSESSPLQMSQEEAISKFRQFQTETAASCNKVIEFAKAKWKSEEMLKLTIKSIKISFLELYQNLQILNGFSTHILENSKTCGDNNLTKKIWKHLQPLQDAICISKDALEKLDVMNWNPEKIAISVRLAVREGGDCLSQIVSSARNVLIHIRSLNVTIIGNANVLFSDSTVEDNIKTDDKLSLWVQKTEEPSDRDKMHVLEIMRLLGQQMKSQTEHVGETVNDFIKILSFQAPNAPSKDTVISHSKFVVRSATQLVFIAKNLTDAQIKTIPNQKIELEGNNLCNILKLMINTAKEMLMKPEISNQNFEHLTFLLKSVQTHAKTLENAVVESVTPQHKDKI